MNKKSMSNILSERMESLQDRLENATTEKEKLIYSELMEQTKDDLKRVKSRNIKKLVYRTIGGIMLILIIIQGVVIVQEYLSIQQYNREHHVDDSIGSGLNGQTNNFN